MGGFERLLGFEKKRRFGARGGGEKQGQRKGLGGRKRQLKFHHLLSSLV